MCICLSTSVEITSSSSCLSPSSSPSSPSPLPFHCGTTRHRRSVSDTLLLQRIGNKLAQYSSDDTASLREYSTYSRLVILPLTNNYTTPPLPSFQRPLSSIPSPPPPPPLPKARNAPKQPIIPIHEELAKFFIPPRLEEKKEEEVLIKPLPQSSTPPSQTPTPCNVCFEDVLPKDFFAFMPCIHSFCKECVQEHIKILVSMGQKLVCLSPNCKSILPEGRAVPLMDEVTLKRYHLLIKTPAGAHRWCPRPGCDTPYIKADVDSSSPRVDCRVKWHEDQTCEEYKAAQEKEKTEEELLSEKYAQQNLQECPNCSIWVEKIDGCEYVMCSACHHEFCWDCLEPHDHNMGAHIHGPRYKATPLQIRRVRRARARKVGKVVGLGVAGVVLGPPALALGVAAAAVVLPIYGIHALASHLLRKRRQKKQAKKYSRPIYY